MGLVSIVNIDMLTHNRVELALHTLRGGTGRPLLLLHGLGEQSPSTVPDTVTEWGGPIAALDFTGHGASTMPTGGGYTAEILMADADAVVQHLGETTIVGRGLGAYVALLIAGARPQFVRGVVLADGPGLSGGPSSPTSQPVFSLDRVDVPPDPYALAELGRDLRPPDYGTAFSRLALQGSDLEQPITVTARFRPSWLRAVAGEPGVGEADSIRSGLEIYMS